MKLILYSWGANNEKVLQNNLIKLGHEIIVFARKCENYTRDIMLAQELIGLINERHVDGVISFNYFPIISMVCDTTKITYYSWVYDCPHFTLYAKTVGLPCNRIGIFDKAMVKTLNERGINTVFHLPLAADTDGFDRAIAKNKKKIAGNEKYRFDASFVGSLYTDEHNYFDMLYQNSVPESVKAYLQKYAGNYLSEPSYIDIDEDDLVDAAVWMNENGLMLGEDYNFEPLDILMPSVYEKKLTVMDRDALLHKIDIDNDIHFGLYTNSKTDIGNYGICTYSDMMPCVFNASKINLNISLRSIHSGVPLRIMDIMASGGFVLSNYQPEIEEMFETDSEIVTYSCFEECEEKVKFYLKNNSIRERIAISGYERIKKNYSYSKSLTVLLGE